MRQPEWHSIACLGSWVVFLPTARSADKKKCYGARSAITLSTVFEVSHLHGRQQPKVAQHNLFCPSLRPEGDDPGSPHPASLLNRQPSYCCNHRLRSRSQVSMFRSGNFAMLQCRKMLRGLCGRPSSSAFPVSMRKCKAG